MTEVFDIWGDEQNEKTPFVIDDDFKAEWAMAKITEARAEYQKWHEHFQRQDEAAKNRMLGTVDFMTAKLEEYFANIPHREAKASASYSLPSGKLVMKKATTRLDHDDGKIIEFLKSERMSDYIKIKEGLDWAALKSALDPETGCMIDTGEEIPGVTVEPVPETFSVQIKEG